MPYKDTEAKRRYMTRYYEQKIKTGSIPSTQKDKEKGLRDLKSKNDIKTLSQTSIKSAASGPVKFRRINGSYCKINSVPVILRPTPSLRPAAPAPSAARPTAKSARPPHFITARDLFRPYPAGLPASQVCPFCNNTRFSSPGTPCSYCR